MDELINKIDNTVRRLMRYETQEYAAAAEDLANSLVTYLPNIVSFYLDPRMSEHAEDATYWPGQVDRILKAFEAGDDMATADVLYNETRANLIELQCILKDKGII